MLELVFVETCGILSWVCIMQRKVFIMCELWLLLTVAIVGCSLLCYPSAYNVDIGSAHWEVMLRARCVVIVIVE